ncbi:MAG: hypothetical protein V1716_05220 [Candidatus Uhrbacteria bacterium]
MKNAFSVSTSVSLATGITTVNLEINGNRITLRLIDSNLVVSGGRELTVNTQTRPASVDKDLVFSNIKALGLSKNVERQLENRGIEFVHQIVVRRDREELFGKMNPSREKWCDEVEVALAKRGLFLGMNLPTVLPAKKTEV